MRILLAGALPLALALTAAPTSIPQAKAEGITSSPIETDAWTSKRKHRHHSSRRSKSYGFAWYFANQSRVEAKGQCAGNRVVATWYQSGRRTASGATFNPNGHTAAHRSMPFGSRVTVTNPRNGQSVTVTINDRGPFTRGVSLDLARGAARSIGMTGTQQVCMS
jgi:rare lipoprotein A